MNIQSAIFRGANILKDKNIFSSQLDAEILMAKAIGKDKKYIILNNHKNLETEELNNFQTLIFERSKRKPIAYITNKKFFWKSFSLNQIGIAFIKETKPLGANAT